MSHQMTETTTLTADQLRPFPPPTPTEPASQVRDEPVAVMEWRCFHCDDVFTSEHDARMHFGLRDGDTPACKIKGADGGLVHALRRAEKDAADAWHAIHAETTDAAKAYSAASARHSEQLRAVEEAAYERGLADAKAHPETLGLQALTTEPASQVRDEPVADWQLAAFDETLALARRLGVPGNTVAVGLFHLEDMRCRITPDFSRAKLGRWLGWAQCAVVAHGLATLDDMKEINRKASEAAKSTPPVGGKE